MQVIVCLFITLTCLAQLSEHVWCHILKSYLVQMCSSRKVLPAEMISRNNFSVWSILKKCIGMVSPSCFPTKHRISSLICYQQAAGSDPD